MLTTKIETKMLTARLETRMLTTTMETRSWLQGTETRSWLQGQRQWCWQRGQRQRVQNKVAGLVLGRRGRDHAKPILRSLHWLPIRARIEYKLSALYYRSRDSSTAYLSDLLSLSLSLSLSPSLSLSLSLSLSQPCRCLRSGDAAWSSECPTY